MTTPSPDDARTTGREQPAQEPPTSDASELETTAVRRQELFGLRGTRSAAREDATVSPAENQPPPAGSAVRERWREPGPAGDPLLDGATHAGPRSRAPAHWWSLLLTLVLSPVAWYLVADAGARLTLGGADSPWARGEVNPAALVELGAGLVVTTVVLLTARWSSLGALVTGTVVLLAGLTFVVVPAQTAAFLEPAVVWLRNLNDLGGNVAHHLLVDGPTGRLALYGLGLLLTGVVAHGARRLGRAEERSRAAYARSTGGPTRHSNGRG